MSPFGLMASGDSTDRKKAAGTRIAAMPSYWRGEQLAMLGAIAGDIIGSRFEGHPGPPPDFELFHPNCRFTDDTVCTVAVADALLGDRDFAASLRSFVRRRPSTQRASKQRSRTQRTERGVAHSFPANHLSWQPPVPLRLRVLASRQAHSGLVSQFCR
jgi:hypothetical protein